MKVSNFPFCVTRLDQLNDWCKSVEEVLDQSQFAWDCFNQRALSTVVHGNFLSNLLHPYQIGKISVCLIKDLEDNEVNSYLLWRYFEALTTDMRRLVAPNYIGWSKFFKRARQTGGYWEQLLKLHFCWLFSFSQSIDIGRVDVNQQLPDKEKSSWKDDDGPCKKLGPRNHWAGIHNS